MVTPMPGLAPNTVFAGQFRVVSQLARGGMGTIYQVEQLPTGHPRALKVILPEYAQDPRARERFEQEARIAARIESEHVAQVIAAGVDPQTNTPWLAMELLQGKDLSAVLAERTRLPLAEALEVMKQLGHALSAAHRIGVVHRDLKPENVFVATSRRSDVAFTVKVLDFGVAKWIQESQAARATAVVGSPLWMAPEQLDARGILGPHTDIWALGLLFFAMLVGRPYWKSAQGDSFSLPEVVGEIMAAPLVPATQRAAEFGVHGVIPPGFDAWFARCVARDGALRARTVDEALSMLVQSVGAAASIPSTMAVPAQPTPSGVPATVAIPVVQTPMQGGMGPVAPTPNAPSTMAWTPGAPPFPSGPSSFTPPQPAPPPALQSNPYGGALSSTPTAYASHQGQGQGGAPVWGAAPSYQGQGPGASYQGQGPAPWQSPYAPPPSQGGSKVGVAVGIAVGAFALLCGGGVGAYMLFKPSCGANEHSSHGHCCANGSEWDTSRRACVSTQVAVATPQQPFPQQVPQYPQPQYPQPQYPQPQVQPQYPTPTPQYPTPQYPRPTPTPLPRPRPTIVHACDGVWGGNVIENTGSRGTMNLMVTASSATCARWTEYWQSGARCTYYLTACTVSANGVRGVGRSSSPRCTPTVSASVTCSATGAMFREQVGSVVDTAALARR